MMEANMATLFVVLASFALSFFIGRLIRKKRNSRNEKIKLQQAEQHLAQQSRQVRRAHQRKNSR